MEKEKKEKEEEEENGLNIQMFVIELKPSALSPVPSCPDPIIKSPNSLIPFHQSRSPPLPIPFALLPFLLSFSFSFSFPYPLPSPLSPHPSNMPRVLRRRNKPITIHDDILLRAANLTQVGRVLVAPRLGVKGAVSTVGDAVD